MKTNSKITALKPIKPAKSGLEPPKGLRKAGRQLWEHVCENFNMETHDLVLLESLCQTLDRKNQAEKDIRKHGSLTFTNRHGELKAHPAVGIVKDSNILIARLRRELSLSEAEPDESRPPKLKYGGPK